MHMRLQATVDISSKYKGIVSKVYYKTNEVAHVGKPLVDIRTEGEGAPFHYFTHKSNGLHKHRRRG